jgi:hypothetical protein
LAGGHRDFPVTRLGVSKYLLHFVEANGGSTKSVQHIMSSLKVFSYYIGTEWLSVDASYRVSQVIKLLEFADTTPVRQVRPITLSMINRIVALMDLNRPLELMIAMTMTLCHNSLMRSGELLSGLIVSDFEWDWQACSVTVDLSRTKAHLKGGSERVRIVDYPGHSAFKLLREWFTMWNLWECVDAHVIPRVSKLGQSGGVEFDFSLSATAAWWKLVISEYLVKIGVDPTFYSGHSFRAGGATDLFVARVPYPYIKKMGRWRSDAALKYFRDDFEVADAVAAAFGRCSMGRSERSGW